MRYTDDAGAGGRPPARIVRATGNRRTRAWLAPVLIAAAATQTRAITTRRFVYLIVDPPPGAAGDRLKRIVKETNAKARLHLVPDEQTGDIPPGAKAAAEEIIGDTLADMREQGLFDPRLLLDNRSDSLDFAEYDDLDAWLAETRRLAAEFPLVRQKGQPRRYECWTEAADTMTDLQQALKRFGVTPYSSSGTRTVGAVDRLGRRIVADTLARPHPDEAGLWLPRETVVLYLGDRDPPGMSMDDKIKDGAVWANRWWHEWQFRAQGAGPREAYERACEVVGDDPGPFRVSVMRVAVTEDDVTASSSASTVSAKVAEQYARWWDPEWTRTLQLEGLAIAAVVQRVTDTLERLFDRGALAAVVTAERAAHAEALRRLDLGGPAAE